MNRSGRAPVIRSGPGWGRIGSYQHRNRTGLSLMRVAVDFQDERLELDAPEGRVIADWHGPAGVPAADVYPMVVEALENPRQYPPLRQAVVPGDRVVVALDLEVPEIRRVLAAVCDTLQH